MRQSIIVLTFLSTILFPWPLTALLALLASSFEPLIPLSVGIFADTLYYVPHGTFLPAATLTGACVTVIAFFVRSRLKAGSI